MSAGLRSQQRFKGHPECIRQDERIQNAEGGVNSEPSRRFFRGTGMSKLNVTRCNTRLENSSRQPPICAPVNALVTGWGLARKMGNLYRDTIPQGHLQPEGAASEGECTVLLPFVYRLSVSLCWFRLYFWVQLCMYVCALR